MVLNSIGLMGVMRSTELLAFYRGLADRDLVIADLETTGFKPPIARVTEISVIHASLRDGVRSQHTSLINSNTEVPFNITQFTGITQEMVDDAPEAESVWREYFPKLNQGVLACHNLDFDYPFMRSELQRCGIEFEKSRDDRLCTVILSRLMLPDLPSRSLPNLVKHFRFDVGQSHRAEADTMACWLLLERLLTDLLDTPDERLLKCFGKQWLTDDDAATMLGCSRQEAIALFESAGIKIRTPKRSGVRMVMRSDVERIMDEREG
jgi:DNA polymerase III subunit epsilon